MGSGFVSTQSLGSDLEADRLLFLRMILPQSLNFGSDPSLSVSAKYKSHSYANTGFLICPVVCYKRQTDFILPSPLIHLNNTYSAIKLVFFRRYSCLNGYPQ